MLESTFILSWSCTVHKNGFPLYYRVVHVSLANKLMLAPLLITYPSNFCNRFTFLTHKSWRDLSRTRHRIHQNSQCSISNVANILTFVGSGVGSRGRQMPRCTCQPLGSQSWKLRMNHFFGSQRKNHGQPCLFNCGLLLFGEGEDAGTSPV